MNNAKSKVINSVKKVVKHRSISSIENMVPEIKCAIIDKYDEELVDVVASRNSKTNPNLYRDEFIKRLDDFVFIEKGNNSITLVVPDEENFDFSGRLRIIEAIESGLAGTYVEMNEDDYKAVFGKRPVNEDTVDDYTSPEERIYLVRYNSIIKKMEGVLNKKFEIYPFSNTPPISILSAGNEFVKKNIGNRIKKSLDDSIKEAVKKSKGVI